MLSEIIPDLQVEELLLQTFVLRRRDFGIDPDCKLRPPSEGAPKSKVSSHVFLNPIHQQLRGWGFTSIDLSVLCDNSYTDDESSLSGFCKCNEHPAAIRRIHDFKGAW